MVNRPADPNPREILGADLKAGMQTYYRVLDHDGNVKFKADHWLKEQIDVGMSGTTTGCRQGVHFRTERGTVCYYIGGRLWVKDVKHGQ
jgi:hypothetical protein